MNRAGQTQPVILVVDDTPASSVLVENGLAVQGYRVLAARNGEDGLRLAQQERPDLILLDILMPGIDGFETCQRLKQSPLTCDIPVIFMTGMDDTRSQLASFDAGGVDYVAKPFQLPEVLARVRSHLTLRDTSKQLKTRVTELLRAENELRGYREQLQQLVEERTAELERTNDELRVTNRRLEEAQVQLVQSEKMASIGVLAAGVAHEINNPIGFVSSNLSSLETYIGELLALIDAYGKTDATLTHSFPAMFAVIRTLRDQIDLDYLAGDVRELLQESNEGLGRVKRIVQDLKDFSHLNASDWQLANLRHGLETTLNIVWNELKYKAEVVCNYGEMPEVECLPSELNQVFLNLLINASQAIQTHGEIRIATGVRGEEVWIEIADTGAGIPVELQARIFDPFFTTKPVGQGTGLGLSLSYSIVQKHHGRIEVESEIGCGTRFRLWLPIKQPASLY